MSARPVVHEWWEVWYRGTEWYRLSGHRSYEAALRAAEKEAARFEVEVRYVMRERVQARKAVKP